MGGRVYGYDNVEVKNGDQRLRVEYNINDKQPEMLREILPRYAAGEGLRTLAKDLDGRGVEPACHPIAARIYAGDAVAILEA